MAARPFIESIPNEREQHYKDKEPKFGTLRTLAIFVITFIILLLIKQQLDVPYDKLMFERYSKRGDVYFQALDYGKAEEQYRKALVYQKGDVDVLEKIDMLGQVRTNPKAAKLFFEQNNITGELVKLSKSEIDYTTPKDALKAGVDLYTQGDYGYARYPIEKALELDTEYAEAWHYLAMTYEKLAEFDAQYKEKAVEARNKRDALTPMYLDLK